MALSKHEICHELDREVAALLDLCADPFAEDDDLAGLTDLETWSRSGQPWGLLRDQDNVRAYSRHDENCVALFMKGVTAIQAEPAAVAEVVLQSQNRRHYDPSYLASRVLEVVQEHPYTQIEHSMFKSGSMLVSNRDFCSADTHRVLDGGVHVICSRSVSHPECPEQKGFVRGELRTSGFVLRPSCGGGTYVQFVACVDPKGSVPAFVRDLFAVEQPQSLGTLRTFIEKQMEKEMASPVS